MIATSTLVMFVLMYLNSYQLSHVFFSETRTYMAIYMGAAMAVVMLLFMLNMYKDKKKNSVVLGISIISFVGRIIFSTFANNGQRSVLDVSHDTASFNRYTD